MKEERITNFIGFYANLILISTVKDEIAAFIFFLAALFFLILYVFSGKSEE